MQERQILIFLNFLQEISPKKINQIWQAFEDKSEILRNTQKLKELNLKEKVIDKIKNKKIRDKFKKELDLAYKKEIKIITILDEEYPQILREIYDPPPVLYIKGKFDPCSLNLAIVGTRRASFYGLSQSEYFAYELALRGVVIISGLARGIDTYAHKGALKAKSPTYAVLGSGLDNIYPPENRNLAQQIVEKGALISEFPLETPPFKKNFPQRNRIISGLSFGVFVIEAGRKSGALITADFALEQGREVFALPNQITNTQSQGVLNLIKEGAKLVTSPFDILEELPLDFKRKVVKENKEKIELTENEERILKVLESPLYFDEILSSTRLEPKVLNTTLLELKLKDLIEFLPGGKYARKKGF